MQAWKDEDVVLNLWLEGNFLPSVKQQEETH